MIVFPSQSHISYSYKYRFAAGVKARKVSQQNDLPDDEQMKPEIYQCANPLSLVLVELLVVESGECVAVVVYQARALR